MERKPPEQMIPGLRRLVRAARRRALQDRRQVLLAELKAVEERLRRLESPPQTRRPNVAA